MPDTLREVAASVDPPQNGEMGTRTSARAPVAPDPRTLSSVISRPVRTAAALLLVSLLGACTSTEADPRDPSVDAAQETPAPAVERYVALGDSYTAAPLIAGTSSNDGCFRSGSNYPSLLAAKLDGARLVDNSCSGATTANMTVRQPNAFGGRPWPPQFRGLTRGTDLVTLGIGGNDFDVFSNLTGLCPRLRPSDPTGNPCQRAFSSTGTDTLLRDASRISARVAGVIRDIQKRAPAARIVVVDYPRVVPTTGTCPRRLPLADGDYPWAATISARLSASVRGAAKRTGAEFVDMYAASNGHDICSDDPWVNGRKTEPGTALAYHPLAVEQQAVADLVLDLVEAPKP